MNLKHIKINGFIDFVWRVFLRPGLGCYFPYFNLVLVSCGFEHGTKACLLQSCVFAGCPSDSFISFSSSTRSTRQELRRSSVRAPLKDLLTRIYVMSWPNITFLCFQKLNHGPLSSMLVMLLLFLQDACIRLKLLRHWWMERVFFFCPFLVNQMNELLLQNTYLTTLYVCAIYFSHTILCQCGAALCLACKCQRVYSFNELILLPANDDGAKANKLEVTKSLAILIDCH